MTLIFEHHITFDPTLNDISNTALAVLCASLKETEYALSTSQIKQAISKGALWLTRGKHTQRLRRVKKALLPTDKLHFYYNEAVLASEVTDARLISDEGKYSVWYKPFGMLSQGSKWSDHCTIARFAQQHLTPERPVFIVHRLDKAATGLILIAHSKKAARALTNMFESRSTTGNLLAKNYQIIVHGNHSTNPQPQIISSEVDEKAARSIFTCLAYDRTHDQSLISVKIDTGRKHQIRIHAASIGFPVVGDRLHGIANSDSTKNLQLCAVSLSFICPFSTEQGQPIQKKFEIPDALKLSFV
ncbi:RNA pseudouridine synthase [Colwellia sp. 4_MG-2023]|jgi:tRNA pseudouridine32 synthase/23S rRNA pseudouridine746 synthase|uniref:RluA family pseudouridine synthase n=1 Tax=unclassified Colwellia TaxID=196834 RepID=UPI001C089DAA|nr:MULTISPECIES: RNA pseudouridine synthase [unclassified Colwellia]MBU2926416.1 RNA pseudouridine synthase [Colwellia sp. C2M11]MDO6488064.1 RNA pseudouridine synthase [Colwellia sp. 6_MG-2023]MDO6506480.1 RNA pseudouridine synthase [Colwellia sp. 5_MG-2023]MDO6554967.1 RNA pseudouridine synthase [Colwellia sp. 4_MG-2023]MDO6651854.1 RNA pseudouridine synthase [Colwellia sp. 3_MG-2023]